MERVLFVDDEPHVLEGLARSLRNRFDIHTATSGAEGLQMLQNAGPFSVVVSDMRMPQMNGAQFLAKVCELSPDSVRVILSGQSDIAATIAAVNEGNIFRFLSKPCSTQYLLAAVGMAVEQHQLITSEKMLLEQTLGGAVKMLIEILGVVSPAAHSRALRLQRYVNSLVTTLQLREHWQWPMAALLSQIGCMSLPKDTMSKVEAGQSLTDEERSQYELHPELAGRLLEGIPRLEAVAGIVRAQNGFQGELDVTSNSSHWDVMTAGSILLCAACEFDRQAARFRQARDAAEAVRSTLKWLPEQVIEALITVPVAGQAHVLRQVRLVDLAAGMLLDEPLLTRKGTCLVPSGQEVTPSLLIRLRSICAGAQLKEPFRVQVPT
jgi:response regulator RpfG family c-di-GMP phosphodiesterase